VVGNLVTVGFPPCAGGFMATNWHRPLAAWNRLFSGWIEQPEPEALLEAANFFDYRAIHGGLDLEPLEQIVRAGSGRRLFLAQMARAALDLRPPLGMLHGIRESPAGVDLKAGALMPIVGLARIFALEAGDRHGSTLHRLRTARRAGKISESGAELLTEAFRFTFGLRLRHHLESRRAGREIDNHVHLDDLSPGERRHLKEAFLVIDKMQRATADRLDLHRLG
jgi:CBS domain-containing protein